jgi:hypothetical protein
MLGAVTYPEPAVVETINKYFIPVQINTQDEGCKARQQPN